MALRWCELDEQRFAWTDPPHALVVGLSSGAAEVAGAPSGRGLGEGVDLAAVKVGLGEAGPVRRHQRRHGRRSVELLDDLGGGESWRWTLGVEALEVQVSGDFVRPVGEELPQQQAGFEWFELMPGAFDGIGWSGVG